MKRGSIKVMVGKNGIPRIQEDLGDTIKVYNHDEWEAEKAKRAGETKMAEPKPKKVEVEKEEEMVSGEVEAKVVDKIVSKGKKKAK